MTLVCYRDELLRYKLAQEILKEEQLVILEEGA
jgi:hypothetical protein